MNGTILEVHALSEGLLCETDVYGNMTIYTKFKVDQCGTGNDPENMYITMYNCDTSTCESCDENPELVGYATKDLFEIKSLTENVNHCFGWHTTSYDNQTSASIFDEVGQAELAYQKFIAPCKISIYNICIKYVCYNSVCTRLCFVFRSLLIYFVLLLFFPISKT